jgi:hypothetical protein
MRSRVLVRSVSVVERSTVQYLHEMYPPDVASFSERCARKSAHVPFFSESKSDPNFETELLQVRAV